MYTEVLPNSQFQSTQRTPLASHPMTRTGPMRWRIEGVIPQIHTTAPLHAHVCHSSVIRLQA